MPNLKDVLGFRGFQNLAQRLSVTNCKFTYALTRGWTVVFELTQHNPELVFVDFFYNGTRGIDEESPMFVVCDINTVDELFVKAQAEASENMKDHKDMYKGCYGVGVFRELCTLRDKEHKGLCK